jgi:CheY-like chemotaxis protein
MTPREPARTILVVDDERLLADTLAAIFERAGYKCTAAYSPTEALATLTGMRPDLIITDVMMPAMNGVEFAIQADKMHPGVKILLISGHAGTQDILAAAHLEGLSIELLAKPVLPEELLFKVAGLLNRSYSI